MPIFSTVVMWIEFRGVFFSKPQLIMIICLSLPTINLGVMLLLLHLFFSWPESSSWVIFLFTLGEMQLLTLLDGGVVSRIFPSLSRTFLFVPDLSRLAVWELVQICEWDVVQSGWLRSLLSAGGGDGRLSCWMGWAAIISKQDVTLKDNVKDKWKTKSIFRLSKIDKIHLWCNLHGL